ncbi:hypothetical protein MJG53_017820 [Ovis ammon polii x Ovis aries]|uniref:Uncharacterized protein n=1 Tax=Ovis ammon polii x Ovis aries TaxID=2918886 RepID=A0ACB9U5D7_9CETA|nr:hypothetical protein MJG53_017820 [Ovis ammon polii x Ovis aries]
MLWALALEPLEILQQPLTLGSGHVNRVTPSLLPLSTPPPNPQHQAAHACPCLYLLKSSQEGPQDLDQTVPSTATGKPGHRAGHPGGTAPAGWAQAAAEAQREVAVQHWAAGHEISWASGCLVPPAQESHSRHQHTWEEGQASALRHTASGAD